MLEKLETKVIEMLPDLQEALQKGLEYGGDLFDRFIYYHIIDNIFGIMMASLIFFISLKIRDKFLKVIYEEYENDHDEEGKNISIWGSGFILGILFFVIFFIISINLSAILKLLFIPEVFLIDYFK